ncbi:Acg family FMN-binding oxidoreductase [Klebsiella spallanzanii]|uniref:Twin-arginine translocation pathway signal protein n=1 Tax=Klebsiella spallanzanii TaxID=2587528 RepID=A0A564HNB0_9ENTR|nr:hypothetical protein [Klebsiella spallanzanii]VUS33388.1 hypothetical protein SB6408_00569 [Klebsiella spallanzanii]
MLTQTNKNTGRRRFLRLLGGASILLLPLLNGCSNTAKSTAIAAPVNDGDPRYRWLAVAARAPSSHNMQPWKVALTSRPDKMALYVDTGSLLPAADPQCRQTMISLGGFIELLCMAANADGVHCEVEHLAPNKDANQPVALFTFTRMQAAQEPDGLLPFAASRRVNRETFHQNASISEERLSLLLAAGSRRDAVAHGSVQTGKISEISAQVAEAWRIDLQQPEIMLEMLKVTRIGRREIEHYRDGIAIQGFLPELAERLGMFPRDRVPEQNSAMMKSMREMGEQQASSAAGWVWLVTTGNSRSQQIAAGRAFVRLHLRATQLGIALQPMSQALEDYPAMIESQQKLYQVLTVTPEKETVQMLARIGYADPAPLSPRRNLPDLVI